MNLTRLPDRSRVLQPGETVQDGDYLQIGSAPHVSYAPVCADGCVCNSGTGHVVGRCGVWEIYWRSTKPVDRP